VIFVDDKSYVLITAARNEEAYIEKTIKSVISQTILPKKWVIVSDDSTDQTDEIVQNFAIKYDFIELLRIEREGIRNFASKVYAINAGYKKLKHEDYKFIGNLDADIIISPSYYENVLEKFVENLKLGIAGGIIFENLGKYLNPQHISQSWSVAGAIQMFRRKCYEDIGGYFPSKCGGIDAIAEVMARMHGWKVKSFSDIKALHIKRTGTKNKSIYSSMFFLGIQNYFLGYHPLFELAKCLYRLLENPYILGSILVICGYFWAWINRKKRELPPDFINYLRTEQLLRMKSRFLFLSTSEDERFRINKPYFSK